MSLEMLLALLVALGGAAADGLLEGDEAVATPGTDLDALLLAALGDGPGGDGGLAPLTGGLDGPSPALPTPLTTDPRRGDGAAPPGPAEALAPRRGDDPGPAGPSGQGAEDWRHLGAGDRQRALRTDLRADAAPSMSGPVLAAGGLGALVVLGVALWHRLTREDLLEHPLRAGILGHLRGEARSLGDLVRLTGASRGALRHHLRHLVRTRHVERHQVAGRVLYTLPGEGPRDPVLVVVAEAPGLHLREIARRSGLSPSAVRRRVEALRQEDRVRVERAGGIVRVLPAS